MYRRNENVCVIMFHFFDFYVDSDSAYCLVRFMHKKTLGKGSEKILFWLQKRGLVAQKTDTKCLDAKITPLKWRQGNVCI